MAASSTREPARVSVAGALAIAGERQAGQQREPDRRRRGDVADVPLERDRLALLAGRGQRGEHVGERGEQDDGAEHPHERLRAAPERVGAGADEAASTVSGQRNPNDVVEAGEEPVGPDLGVAE